MSLVGLGVSLAISCSTFVKNRFSTDGQTYNNIWPETIGDYWNPEESVSEGTIADASHGLYSIYNDSVNDHIKVNMSRLKNDIKVLKSYPLSWWDNYDYDNPSDKVYNNVDSFLSLNPIDGLLKDAIVIPESNATLVIYWKTNSMIATVNIGDNDFSYVIYPLSSENPIMGQSHIDDENAIYGFYNSLQKMI